MPSAHRNPALLYRPDPELRDRAKIAVSDVGSNMNAHLTAFLEWLVGDTDTLPARPDAVQAPTPVSEAVPTPLCPGAGQAPASEPVLKAIPPRYGYREVASCPSCDNPHVLVSAGGLLQQHPVVAPLVPGLLPTPSEPGPAVPCARAPQSGRTEVPELVAG